jgi:hypothetical protein
MSTTPLPAEAADALRAAIATRGPHKGRLLKKAPPFSTLAYAAWQGAMMAINPYKVSIFGVYMMDDAQRAVQEAVTSWFDSMPRSDRIEYDRDRRVLEAIGVW